MKKFKLNQICYVLYVNLTTNYISFKIEKGVYLGDLQDSDLEYKKSYKGYHMIEHEDDEVNYLKIDDFFNTEDEALLALIKMIKRRLNKSNENTNNKKKIPGTC